MDRTLPVCATVALLPGDDAALLQATLHTLALSDHADFQVLTIDGPVWRDTRLTTYRDSVRRLARSDDSGEPHQYLLAHAVGMLVALLEPGVCVQPRWLSAAIATFREDDEIAVAGAAGALGVLDGWFIATRRGELIATKRSYPPMFPGAARIPLPDPAGTIFHRERLQEAGGFVPGLSGDLAIADAAFRLVDLGYTIKVLDTPGVVSPHEQRSPRNGPRIALALGARTSFVAQRAARGHRADADTLVTCPDLDKLADPSGKAQPTARRGPGDEPAMRGIGSQHATNVASDLPVGPYPLHRPRRPLHLVFFCQWHSNPPKNGLERIVHQLARGLADRGHTVRLMTRGGERRRIGFDDGLWVHAVPVTPHGSPPDLVAPDHFWNYAASLHEELLSVDRRHPVDAVQCPNWDSEGIAAIASAKVTTVLGVYTPFKTWLPLNARKLQHVSDLAALVAAERYCYAHADRLLACGRSIVKEVEHQYGMALAPHRIAYLAHGMIDMSRQVRRRRASDDGEIRILFVGRLERRKGIDTVLACIAPICHKHRNVHFVIVGDDTLEEEPGLLHRVAFEQSSVAHSFTDRVRFTGLVDETALWQHYADCDIFLAPSRFESFGLTLVEAMMFGRPVIGGQIPGMGEVVTHGVDGFLTPPDDAAALVQLIDRLVVSPDLRQQIGYRGRRTYETKFTLTRMIDNAENFYCTLADQAKRNRPVPVA